MSSPRLEPWLMPETIRSASKPSTRPSEAKRTQSTGVPSVAYPAVPSPKSTSCTHSARRVVIPRPIAERLESGAITASSSPSIASSARRSAWSPSASMPSSLVSRTRMSRQDIARLVVARQQVPGALELVAQVVRRRVVGVGVHHAGVLARLGERVALRRAEREHRAAAVEALHLRRVDEAVPAGADPRVDHQAVEDV